MNQLLPALTLLIVQVTAVSLAFGVGILIAKKRPAIRHSFGLIVLLVAMVAPITVWLLPVNTYWRMAWATPAEASLVPIGTRNATQLESKVPAAKFDLNQTRATEPPLPIEIGSLDQPNRASMVQSEMSNHSTSRNISNPKSFVNSWMIGGIFIWFLGVAISVGKSWRLRRRLNAIRNSAVSSQLDPVLIDTVRHALRIRNLPAIATTELSPIPMVLGTLRPLVLIPKDFFESATINQLRDVLVHECAHVLRRDPWILLLQRIVGILYWPHPLVHWINREISKAREEICDNFVLRNSEPTEYAQTLVQLSESTGRMLAASPLGLFTNRWTLEQRVLDIVSDHRDNSTGSRPLITFASVFAVVGLLISIGGARSQAPNLNNKQPSNASSSIANSGLKQDALQTGQGETKKRFQLSVEQRERFAKYLEIGPNEVADKKAVVKMLAERARENEAKIKTWEGVYTRESNRHSGDIVTVYECMGSFVIDNVADSIFITAIPQKNPVVRNVATGIERTSSGETRGTATIATSEHVLSASLDLFGGSLRIEREPRTALPNICDPRDYFAPDGWRPTQFLDFIQKATEAWDDFSDVNSIAKISGPDGLTYEWKSLYNFQEDQKRTQIGVLRFSERSGFQLVFSELKPADNSEMATFSRSVQYENVDGTFLPKTIMKSTKAHYGNQEAGNEVIEDEQQIRFVLSKLNGLVSSRTFTTDQFAPKNGLEFYDKIDGKYFVFHDQKLVPSPQPTIEPNGQSNPIGQDHYAKLIQNYRIRLIADPNGKLISVRSGERNDTGSASNIDDVIKDINSINGMVGTGLASKLTIVLIPDENLNVTELASVMEKLKTEITLTPGGKVMSPNIVVATN
jgi:beta-lactamase regulating signal transducer with metallopeptidase domain